MEQGRVQDLPKGEGSGPWRTRGARAYNGGLGSVIAPSGLQGQPGRSSQKLKAFRLFSYKRAKSLVFKLKKTPYVWSMGGGPPIPGSASAVKNIFELLFCQYIFCRIECNYRRPMNDTCYCVRGRMLAHTVVLKMLFNWLMCVGVS